MKKIYILLVLFSILLACDSGSGPDSTDDNMIREIIQEIALAFNFGDIEGVMTFYHPDFLHNGNDLDSETTVWELRAIDYNEMEISDININYQNDDYAVVSFMLEMSGSSMSDSWQEPSEENGDISYFFRDFSGWMIVGNQEE